MKRRTREGRSAEEQIAAITIFVAVVLIAAVLRLFQRSVPTDLVGMLINGVGQLWVLALVSTPILVLWWRHILRAHKSKERIANIQAQLGALSPEGFEEWSAKRLSELGYAVRRTGGQGDHGVDLIASKAGVDTVVQCKRYAGKRAVGEPDIRDLFGVMHHHAAPEAILITAGWFTPQAQEWAKGNRFACGMWIIFHGRWWFLSRLRLRMRTHLGRVSLEPALSAGQLSLSAAIDTMDPSSSAAPASRSAGTPSQLR